MAIVTAPGRFCYLECDEPACGRKIYQYHEEIVEELARLSGWKHQGASWTCPVCSEKAGLLRSRPSKEPIQGRLLPGPGGVARHRARSVQRKRSAPSGPCP